MNKERCLICFAVSSRLVNILNTHLVTIYEKLTDLKVSNESQYLCFICNRRLQQCYQLQQLAIKQKHVSFCKDSFIKQNIYKSSALITLSIAKLLEVTIPSNPETLVEKTINVKQEVDEEVTCVLELEIQQDNLEYLQKQEIKIENKSSDCLGLVPINKNYSEIGKATQVLQSCHHIDLKLEELNTDKILDDKSPMDGGTKYTCDICPYESNCERDLNNHHLIHTECIYNKLYENKISECVDKTKSYICDICNKTLSTKHILIVHMGTHTGEKLYHCNICNLVFTVNNDLITHKKTHSGNRPYVCDICNKTFTQCGNLKRHKILHTGEKPFQCNFCDKKFRQKSHLMMHKRIHTNIRPYCCDICNKSYCQRSHLIVHKRIHTDNKSYHCDTSSKVFSISSDLITDKITHSYNRPHVCNVCNKTFTQHSTLKRHKRSHTGDRPYSCDVCNKTFTQNSTLISHKRTHTGEKPYICDLCDKRFAASSSLKTHKKLHKDNKPSSKSVVVK